MSRLSQWVNYFLYQKFHFMLPRRKVSKREFEQEVYRVIDERYGLDITLEQFDTAFDDVLSRMTFVG